MDVVINRRDQQRLSEDKSQQVLALRATGPVAPADRRK
jgi:hypothetical protein